MSAKILYSFTFLLVRDEIWCNRFSKRILLIWVQEGANFSCYLSRTIYFHTDIKRKKKFQSYFLISYAETVYNKVEIRKAMVPAHKRQWSPEQRRLAKPWIKKNQKTERDEKVTFTLWSELIRNLWIQGFHLFNPFEPNTFTDDQKSMIEKVAKIRPKSLLQAMLGKKTLWSHETLKELCYTNPKQYIRGKLRLHIIQE